MGFFFVSVLILTAQATVWDGVTKPQMTSKEGNLEINTFDDVTLKLEGRGNAGLISLWDLKANSQQRVVGTCEVGQAISAINLDGSVECRDTVSPSAIIDIRTVVDELKARECGLSAWSEWSACSANCEGSQTQTRTIMTEAKNSLPCSEYLLEKERSCGGDCDDFCGNHERWFNINSGLTYARVASYAGSNEIYVRRPVDKIEYGGRGHGRSFHVVKREDLTPDNAKIDPVAWGWGSWRTGDYMCGTQGDIEVLGYRGNLSLTPDVSLPVIDNEGAQWEQQREWVPERMAGTRFIVPAKRGIAQHFQILALEKSVVTVIYGNDTAATLLLAPYESTSWNDHRTQKNYHFESTGRILMTAVNGEEYTTVGAETVGWVDFIPVVPAAKTLYGISSFSLVSAITVYQTEFHLVCSRDIVLQTPILDSASNNDLYVVVPNGKILYAGGTCNLTVTEGRDELIGVVSVGDGDGTESTMWMPFSLMRKQFTLVTDARHMAFTCVSESNGQGEIRVTTLAGRQLSISMYFENGMAKVYSVDRSLLLFGTHMNSTHPCSLVIDDHFQKEMSVFGSGGP
eukprot:m.147451 g.147451  ORF g.147451 m.147451 type:complete len:571 (-) comp30538_c0_seq1:28-1740(-)